MISATSVRTAVLMVIACGMASGNRFDHKARGAFGSASINVVGAPWFVSTEESVKADVVLPTPPLLDANTITCTETSKRSDK